MSRFCASVTPNYDRGPVSLVSGPSIVSPGAVCGLELATGLREISQGPAREGHLVSTDS